MLKINVSNIEKSVRIDKYISDVKKEYSEIKELSREKIKKGILSRKYPFKL